MMLLPILSLLAGVTLFGEILLARQWVGCGVVLVSCVLAVSARTTSPVSRKAVKPVLGLAQQSPTI